MDIQQADLQESIHIVKSLATEIGLVHIVGLMSKAIGVNDIQGYCGVNVLHIEHVARLSGAMQTLSQKLNGTPHDRNEVGDGFLGKEGV
jgi:hypothetical protein